MSCEIPPKSSLWQHALLYINGHFVWSSNPDCSRRSNWFLSVSEIMILSFQVPLWTNKRRTYKASGAVNCFSVASPFSLTASKKHSASHSHSPVVPFPLDHKLSGSRSVSAVHLPPRSLFRSVLPWMTKCSNAIETLPVSKLRSCRYTSPLARWRCLTVINYKAKRSRKCPNKKQRNLLITEISVCVLFYQLHTWHASR